MMDVPEIPRSTVAKRSRNAANSPTAPRPLVPDFFANKKRKLVEDAVVQADVEEDDWEIPSDTRMALRAMKRDFMLLAPDIVQSFPPIIMKSHLYYLMDDRTKVDRELNELKTCGEVMEMMVPGKDPNDAFLCLSADIASFITTRINLLQRSIDSKASGQGHSGGKISVENSPFPNLSLSDIQFVLQFFLKSTVGKHPEAFINRENLHNVYDQYVASSSSAESSKSSIQLKTNQKKNPTIMLVVDSDEEEENISSLVSSSTGKSGVLITPEKKVPKIKYTDMEKVLIQEGWMTRRDVSSFWLSIPQFGRFVKSLQKGRSHIKSVLKRAKFHEMMLNELLEMKKVKGCELSMPYIVKDLIGASFLTRVVLAAGILVRMSPAIVT